MDVLSDYLESAKSAALEAGSLVRSHLKDTHEITSKSRYDFVTEVDKLSECFLRKYLLSRYPDHIFFGEEEISSSAVSEEYVLSSLPEDKYIWVIDPIDGTTNFIRGIPQYAICIGLVYGQEVVAGAVYDIAADKLYYARKGGDSFCNGKKIHVSDTASISSSIVVTSFPASDMRIRRKVLDGLSSLGMDFLSLRIWNCAALAAISVAEGCTDIYVEAGIHLWDFSAASIIIRNAGGYFSDLEGNPWNRHQKNVLCTNKNLHAQALEMLSTVI